MDRTILTAPDGKYYTNGETYGKEIYLSEGLDGADFYLIEETEVQDFEDATIEDYETALSRMGVAL